MLTNKETFTEVKLSIIAISLYLLITPNRLRKITKYFLKMLNIKNSTSVVKNAISLLLFGVIYYLLIKLVLHPIYKKFIKKNIVEGINLKSGQYCTENKEPPAGGDGVVDEREWAVWARECPRLAAARRQSHCEVKRADDTRQPTNPNTWWPSLGDNKAKKLYEQMLPKCMNREGILTRTECDSVGGDENRFGSGWVPDSGHGSPRWTTFGNDEMVGHPFSQWLLRCSDVGGFDSNPNSNKGRIDKKYLVDCNLSQGCCGRPCNDDTAPRPAGAEADEKAWVEAVSKTIPYTYVTTYTDNIGWEQQTKPTVTSGKDIIVYIRRLEDIARNKDDEWRNLYHKYFVFKYVYLSPDTDELLRSEINNLKGGKDDQNGFIARAELYEKLNNIINEMFCDGDVIKDDMAEHFNLENRNQRGAGDEEDPEAGAAVGDENYVCGDGGLWGVPEELQEGAARPLEAWQDVWTSRIVRGLLLVHKYNMKQLEYENKYHEGNHLRNLYIGLDKDDIDEWEVWKENELSSTSSTSSTYTEEARELLNGLRISWGELSLIDKKKYRCTMPVEIANSESTTCSDKGLPGDTCPLECSSGFTASGDGLLTCDGNDRTVSELADLRASITPASSELTFSGSTCLRCGPLVIDHSTTTGICDGNSNDICMIQGCDSGYELSYSDGEFDAEAQQDAISGLGLDYSAGDMVTVIDSSSDNWTIRTENGVEGSVPASSLRAVRKCLDDGTWSGTQIHCAPIMGKCNGNYGGVGDYSCPSGLEPHTGVIVSEQCADEICTEEEVERRNAECCYDSADTDYNSPMIMRSDNLAHNKMVEAVTYTGEPTLLTWDLQHNICNSAGKVTPGSSAIGRPTATQSRRRLNDKFCSYSSEDNWEVTDKCMWTSQSFTIESGHLPFRQDGRVAHGYMCAGGFGGSYYNNCGTQVRVKSGDGTHVSESLRENYYIHPWVGDVTLQNGDVVFCSHNDS